MVNSKTLLALFVVTLIAFPLALTVPLARGQNSALISVNPSNISDFSQIPGSQLSFSIDLLDSPAISGFQVFLSYNYSVLRATGIDYANNVLGSSVSVPVDCVGFIGRCLGGNNANTIELVEVIQGSGTTPSPTNGLLFTVNFNVTGKGLSYLHILSAMLGNGGSAVPVSTSDGYFTNMDCPTGRGVFCTPPIPNFTVSPSTLYAGSPGTFDASTSIATDSGAKIQEYLWNWGASDPHGFSGGTLETSDPIASNTFALPGNFSVTLTVTDTFGSAASKTITVTVIKPPVPPDFTVGILSNFPQDVIAGRSISLPVLVSSVAGFTGSVNLTVAVLPVFESSPNVTASLSIDQLSVQSGGTNSTILRVSADKNSVHGEAYVMVTGTSGNLRHSSSLLVGVVRPIVYLSCLPIPDSDCGFVFVSPGANVSLPIFLFGYFGFQGSVNLPSTSGTFGSVLWSQSSLMLDANGTGTLRVTILTKPQVPLGLSPIYLAGTSQNGTVVPVLIDLFVVNPPLPPDIGIGAPSSITLRAGQNATFQASVSSVNGFVGNVNFATGPFPLFPRGNIQLYAPSGFPGFFSLAANQTVSINMLLSTDSLTIPGNYTIWTDASALVALLGRPTCCPVDLVTITTVIVLPPADPPIFVQFHWKHVLSYLKQATSTNQDFAWGISNSNNSTTLYLDVSVTGFSQNGVETFNVDSGLLTLLPGQTVTNLHLIQGFGQSDSGSTFYFNTVVRWGISRDILNLSNSSAEGPISGSFTIKAR
jgi:hypothetical protein